MVPTLVPKLVLYNERHEHETTARADVELERGTKEDNGREIPTLVRIYGFCRRFVEHHHPMIQRRRAGQGPGYKFSTNVGTNVGKKPD